jgi:hypothetical protein
MLGLSILHKTELAYLSSFHLLISITNSLATPIAIRPNSGTIAASGVFVLIEGKHYKMEYNNTTQQAIL